MKKVRVGIIDTGIDKNCQYLKNNIQSGCKVTQELTYNLDYEDVSGHGTACASVIKKECSEVDFFIINAFNEDNKANLGTIEKALDIVRDQQIDIVNMSFTISDYPGKDLEKKCYELAENTILVASASNLQGKGYPASYSCVNGVKGGNLVNNSLFKIEHKAEIQCTMRNEPLMSATIGNKYQMIPPNNSLLTAKFTGILCKLISTYGIQKDDYKNILHMINPSAFAFEVMYKKESDWYIDSSDELLNDIYKLLSKTVKLYNPMTNICDYQLLTRNGFISFKDVYNILSFLEKGLQIEIDYMSVTRYDLLTLGTLTKLFKKSEKRRYEGEQIN